MNDTGICSSVASRSVMMYGVSVERSRTSSSDGGRAIEDMYRTREMSRDILSEGSEL